MWRALLVGMLVLSACGGGNDAESQPVAQAPKKAAGKVVELAGKVTATNAGVLRTLAVGNAVAADDVIETTGDGSVVIELFHNNARWSLETGITSRVDASVAWGLAKQEHAKIVDHATSSAGRHADRQAADSAVTATEKSTAKNIPPTPNQDRETPKVETAKTDPPRPTADTKQPAKKRDPQPVTQDKAPDPKVPARPKEPTSRGCDEVQCTIDPSGACCARYKKPSDSKPKPGPPPEKPDRGDLPEAPTRQDITAAIQQVKPQIMACGEKHAVKGTIKLTIKIAPDGKVSNVTVKETPDQKVDACVIGVVKVVTLPKSEKGVTFTYPVTL